MTDEYRKRGTDSCGTQGVLYMTYLSKLFIVITRLGLGVGVGGGSCVKIVQVLKALKL